MGPQIRAACLTDYERVAIAAGLNPEKMLNAVGLDSECLNRPDLKIPATAVGQLFEDSAKLSGLPDFGLRLAESRRFPVLGPLGLLVREQATLGQAIRMLIRYMHLHSEALHLWLEEDRDLAIIRMELLGRRQAVRQSMELSMGMLYRILRQGMAQNWRARRICFMHDAPPRGHTPKQFFLCAVDYGASFNGIVCSRSDLQTPLSTYSSLDQYAQQYVEAVSVNHGRSAAKKVRQMVYALLPSGECSLDRIARLLGVDVRTVRRRLISEGSSYNEVLNEVRKDLVTRYLSEDSRKHAEIALLLGFSGPSSFSRWFRLEFGYTAQDWPGPYGACRRTR